MAGAIDPDLAIGEGFEAEQDFGIRAFGVFGFIDEGFVEHDLIESELTKFEVAGTGAAFGEKAILGCGAVAAVECDA